MHIIIGLIITIVGGIITIKSEKFLNAFGRIAFFENKFGPEGGSRLGYKLIGFLFIFIGVLIITNMIGGFLTWLLSPILKFSQPGV